MLPRAQLYWRCMELPRIHTPSPTDTRVLIVDPCDDAGGGEANGRDGSRANGRDEQHGMAAVRRRTAANRAIRTHATP